MAIGTKTAPGMAMAMVAALVLGGVGIIFAGSMPKADAKPAEAPPERKVASTAESAPAKVPPLAKAGEAVDAAALVREVRGKEKWIETVKSFHVRATSTLSHSKEAIANGHQLILEQIARKVPPERRLLREVAPSEVGALELAFDGRRAFSHILQSEMDRARAWDGQKGMDHLVLGRVADRDASKSEQYTSRKSAKFLTRIMQDFVWPMADPHPMWWAEQANKEPELRTNGEGPLGPGGLTGDEKKRSKPEAGDFVYLRTEKFRGIDCYVVGLKGAELERWSIGVKDHLLHRVEKGRLGDPDMWKKYLPEAQKRGEVVTDNRTLYAWLESLPKEQKALISGPIEHEYRVSGNAATDFWMLDYVELKPGQWYPKTQGWANYVIKRYDGERWVDDYAHPIVKVAIEIHVTEVQVDVALPDSMFTMAVKEGAKVSDDGE